MRRGVTMTALNTLSSETECAGDRVHAAPSSRALAIKCNRVTNRNVVVPGIGWMAFSSAALLLYRVPMYGVARVAGILLCFSYGFGEKTLLLIYFFSFICCVDLFLFFFKNIQCCAFHYFAGAC